MILHDEFEMINSNEYQDYLCDLKGKSILFECETLEDELKLEVIEKLLNMSIGNIYELLEGI